MLNSKSSNVAFLFSLMATFSVAFFTSSEPTTIRAVGLPVSIPIFNGWQANNRIATTITIKSMAQQSYYTIQGEKDSITSPLEKHSFPSI
ncbi:hypothetical protein N9Y89_00795 [bacterium]|nr:hypothetical protein [bacterium]